MRKHLLGMALFVLIVGVAVYFYSSRTPPASQPEIVVTHPPARENGESVVLDLVKREATVSFNVRADMPDEVWASVEFSSPDASTPRWTTPPVRIAPGLVNHRGQITLKVPCEQCRNIAPQANYYARIMLSAAPDAQPLPEYDADALVPVLLKHQ